MRTIPMLDTVKDAFEMIWEEQKENGWTDAEIDDNFFDTPITFAVKARYPVSQFYPAVIRIHMESHRLVEIEE